MSLEIERRFLARRRLLPPLSGGHRYEQGYLCVVPEVRIRLIDDAQAYVTIKSGSGLIRGEWEYEIPAGDARELLRLTAWSVIAKTRYKLPQDGLVWEIDCYEGDNAGLWSAEVELGSEDAAVTLPPWVADEVTEELRFTNLSLAQQPLSAWLDRERVLAIVES